MKYPKAKNGLRCTCGSREFAIAAKTQSATGRPEYRLCCKQCGTTINVDKSTFALYHYLEQRHPSPEFLQLFDLG